ncbi:putative Ig domain-containing protein [bacterium]|nr:putative Ig domain-containing protein [bacterium]
MSLKKIIRKNIEDSAVTEPKLANEAVTAEKLGTDFITGLDELTSVAEDDNLLISDTSAGALKKVAKSNTTSLDFPTFSSISPDNSQTADGGNITFTITGTGFTTGTNARLIGASGQRLNFDSVTRSSTTSITAVIARSSLLVAQSPYGIQVINGEGLAVTTASLITVDNIPVFNTASGSLGTFTEGDSIDVEVSAYDPDSTSAITYELQSGSLPAGLSLVNQSGDSCRIQGTASAVDADTTSNFTLRATDSASNTTSRAFSITIEDFALNGLRFDDGSSDSLSRTPSTAGNRKTWTKSFWCKRGNLTGVNQHIGGTGGGSDSTWFQLKFNTDDTFHTQIYNGTLASITSRVFRDPSAWYHFVVTVDTTEATASDRVKIWVNSEQQSLTHTRSLTLNQDTGINSTEAHFIGRTSAAYGNFYDGYISEYHLIDGQALDHTSFGETDSNGVWIPKNYSGSYGTNGFHLDFADGADLGNDVSGNNNDFTENNITSIDKVEDTPQNNFITMNPNNATLGGVTLSEGNLKASLNGNYQVFGTIQVTQGKWYWEQKINSSSLFVSVADGNRATENTGTGLLNRDYAWAYRSDGVRQHTNVTSSYGDSFTTNDIIGVALDMDNGFIYFSKNGVFQNSGDPTSGATGTGAAYSGLHTDAAAPDGLTPCLGQYGGDQITTWNFGAPAYTISSGNADANGYGNFEYAVPSGYFALNTKNLAEYG